MSKDNPNKKEAERLQTLGGHASHTAGAWIVLLIIIFLIIIVFR